ncbi:MAG: esterase/lipase family protein [Verrucomicrobiales bacterium]
MRWLVLPTIALTLSGCTNYSVLIRNSDRQIANTPEQKALVSNAAKAGGTRRSSAKLGLLLDAAHRSWLRLAADASDAEAVADYNFVVARVVEEMERVEISPENPYLSGRSPDGSEWNLKVELASGQPDLEILAADRFRFRGQEIREPAIREGIGAPVIAAGDPTDLVDLDPLLESKQIFFGLTALVRFDGRTAVLDFHEPLEEETVTVNGQRYPLGADFRAPLAFKLARINPEQEQRSRFFRPSRYNRTAQISRLQAYSPDKIPVLFVHGLANSPATWMPLLGQLRSDPMIRKHYQFWFFSHPTGIPYPITTAELREELDDMKEDFPDHKDIIVVGHSMGGMIGRLLMTDSGMTLWDHYYDRPPEAIPFSDATREIMTDTLIFESREDIARIIFVAASHRGSHVATNLIGRLGARLVGNPIADSEINREATTYQREEQRFRGRRLPNSVEVLDPDSPWLRIVHTLPLDRSIPFHSIIGDRGRGGNLDRTRPQSSDGIVPYWSSHLEGATAESIVPSGHWVHLHPEGQAEIKRLLLEYLEEGAP